MLTFRCVLYLDINTSIVLIHLDYNKQNNSVPISFEKGETERFTYLS